MTEEKKQAIMNCETFDELLDQEYGPQGTPERASFETEAEAFCLAETLREQRRLAGLTQQELADKIGTKKSYISKLENGHADVQLSTLFRIFAGLGNRKVSKGVISLQNDRGTSYQAYIAVQNELVKAVNELRDEASMREFGKKFLALEETQQKAIKELVPQQISEAEPKDVGKRRR